MIDTETKITAELAAEHGLTSEEFGRVQNILGRNPTVTELGIFSVMWSEHCSYKSSKVHLKRLPTAGSRVVQGPGENAGVVDIGDGLCAVFKIESHNHPSFVEPFQGAATGVGGILRDIFTMGARPIAVLDSLRFGSLTECAGVTPEGALRNRMILDGVVSGIAFYGNCFGVPTIGGEIQFERCYSRNPLVNVLALGIARRDELFFARARGAGNPVIYIGAKTGRDGIHGASLLASAEFDERSQQKRPNVQVGDPFMEKLLLEACLEAMHTGAIVAIQDMGAAGLTSSSCEMASRGSTGIEIELDRVPQRETGMTPYEIMLSESQERMLLVAELGREQEVLRIFSKWGLDAVTIGKVTEDGRLRVLQHGRIAADIPAHAIAEEGPVYRRPIAPSGLKKVPTREVEFAPANADLNENFRTLLASPTIASKQWVFGQYDYMVRTNTRIGPGAGDAAVIRIKETNRALALSTDGNGRWCQASPRVGAMHAVAEAARNVACTGARPVAATNCLNFGNPEKSEVMRQFSDVIDGITDACRALGTPITGGNVSFYNETLGEAIYPTPVLGVMGILEDAECAVGMGFQNETDVICLLYGYAEVRSMTRDHHREFASSEYAKAIYATVTETPPAIDLHADKALIDCLVALAAERMLQSAHDVSDGGLAVTVAESCFKSHGLSAKLELQTNDPVEYVLFEESGARAVISVRPESLARVEQIAAQCKVEVQRIGTVTRGVFLVDVNGKPRLDATIDSLRETWACSLERSLQT